MESLRHALDWALGLRAEPRDLTLLQICLRSLLAYFFGLFILRVARNRLLTRQTAFDVVIGIVLGSVLSRAINGTSPVFLSLAAAAVLVVTHHVLASLSFHSPRWRRLLSGNPETVASQGELNEESLRRHLLSRSDVDEALRLHGQVAEIGLIKEARVERNGKISVVKEPRVLEIKVEAGVQTVRIVVE
jgi:uncharacterized membrane protein YcaP (DUF421 family)